MLSSCRLLTATVRHPPSASGLSARLSPSPCNVSQRRMRLARAKVLQTRVAIPMQDAACARAGYCNATLSLTERFFHLGAACSFYRSRRAEVVSQSQDVDFTAFKGLRFSRQLSGVGRYLGYSLALLSWWGIGCFGARFPFPSRLGRLGEDRKVSARVRFRVDGGGFVC